MRRCFAFSVLLCAAISVYVHLRLGRPVLPRRVRFMKKASQLEAARPL